jgi:SpoVK/Ycf46/Vps4 family AAA+-type ATPase
MIEFVTDKSNGLESIKGKSRHNIRLLIIKMIFTFAKAPILYGNTFLNIMLTGPAGSGKTKIASVFAHAFYKMGFLMRDYVKFATSQNMIGEYIGQSAPKTRTTLQDAIEGVLFIDEAYTLTPCQDVSKNISFQTESMGELINFLDKFKGCLVVIVAGYKDKMYNCFLEFNEGLNRRFPQKIDLIDYSSEDLFLLLKNFLSNIVDPDKAFSKSQQDFILQLLSQLNEHNVFTNQAGDMLNLSTLIIEDAITYMGHYDDVKIIDTFKSFLSSKQLTMDIDM